MNAWVKTPENQIQFANWWPHVQPGSACFCLYLFASGNLPFDSQAYFLTPLVSHLFLRSIVSFLFRHLGKQPIRSTLFLLFGFAPFPLPPCQDRARDHQAWALPHLRAPQPEHQGHLPGAVHWQRPGGASIPSVDSGCKKLVTCKAPMATLHLKSEVRVDNKQNAPHLCTLFQTRNRDSPHIMCKYDRHEGFCPGPLCGSMYSQVCMSALPADCIHITAVIVTAVAPAANATASVTTAMPIQKIRRGNQGASKQTHFLSGADLAFWRKGIRQRFDSGS